MGEEASTTHIPVTYDHGAHVTGPFYHGTRTALAVGDGLIPGHGSNFGHDPNVLNTISSTSRSCGNRALTSSTTDSPGMDEKEGALSKVIAVMSLSVDGYVADASDGVGVTHLRYPVP